MVLFDEMVGRLRSEGVDEKVLSVLGCMAEGWCVWSGNEDLGVVWMLSVGVSVSEMVGVYGFDEEMVKEVVEYRKGK